MDKLPQFYNIWLGVIGFVGMQPIRQRFPRILTDNEPQ
ncbi:MAG: hypothetical protein ACLFUU_13250 [Desulfobacteraceae bacterium]